MDFGTAFQKCTEGNRIALDTWQHCFLFYMPELRIPKVSIPSLGIYSEKDGFILQRAHICIRNADHTIEPWYPAPSEILSNNWVYYKHVKPLD